MWYNYDGTNTMRLPSIQYSEKYSVTFNLLKKFNYNSIISGGRCKITLWNHGMNEGRKYVES